MKRARILCVIFTANLLALAALGGIRAVPIHNEFVKFADGGSELVQHYLVVDNDTDKTLQIPQGNPDNMGQVILDFTYEDPSIAEFVGVSAEEKKGPQNWLRLQKFLSSYAESFVSLPPGGQYAYHSRDLGLAEGHQGYGVPFKSLRVLWTAGETQYWEDELKRPYHSIPVERTLVTEISSLRGQRTIKIPYYRATWKGETWLFQNNSRICRLPEGCDPEFVWDAANDILRILFPNTSHDPVLVDFRSELAIAGDPYCVPHLDLWYKLGGRLVPIYRRDTWPADVQNAERASFQELGAAQKVSGGTNKPGGPGKPVPQKPEQEATWGLLGWAAGLAGALVVIFLLCRKIGQSLAD